MWQIHIERHQKQSAVTKLLNLPKLFGRNLLRLPKILFGEYTCDINTKSPCGLQGDVGNHLVPSTLNYMRKQLFTIWLASGAIQFGPPSRFLYGGGLFTVTSTKCRPVLQYYLFVVCVVLSSYYIFFVSNSNM